MSAAAVACSAVSGAASCSRRSASRQSFRITWRSRAGVISSIGAKSAPRFSAPSACSPRIFWGCVWEKTSAARRSTSLASFTNCGVPGFRARFSFSREASVSSVRSMRSEAILRSVSSSKDRTPRPGHRRPLSRAARRNYRDESAIRRSRARTRWPLVPIDLPPVTSMRRYAAPRAAAMALLTLSIVVAVALVGCAQTPGEDGATDARISSSDVFTWDPARQSDSGTASVLAQVYEGLTSFDAESNVRPALARTWEVDQNGQRITFELRPSVTYSDGTPITAQDVVDSWMRLIDPSNTTTLSSLLADVQGATDYQQKKAGRDAVGLHTDGNRGIVDLRRPATYFLAVTASPSLAVVPPAVANQIASNPPTVVSGAYVPTTPSDGLIHLTANAAYWAGAPELTNIDLVTDYNGTSGAQLFDEGKLDYTSIGSGDASWIAYDGNLGPQLRTTDSFGVSYYGFNTTVAPFDNSDVRRAFAEAVNWDRIVTLSDATPATSLVPPGIPGRDDTDHRPKYDVADAKALLAAAVYATGQTFPAVTLASYGVGYEQTVAKELHDNLGVTVNVEALDFEHYLEQVGAATTPTFWSLSWIADYPHAHDFLGLLLESGSTSNTGKWSNADYDALIAHAAATTDPDGQTALYGQAQDILTREVPVIPVSYTDSWALSRSGLEGALTSGVGLIRYAGLQWAPGTGQ